MSFIDLHTNVSLGHTKITGLGGEKLWLCPTLGGDKLDISGNGNHGTYNGGMGTVADVSSGGSRAYSFDGVNDYIEVPDDDVFSFTNGTSDTAFAVSMWVNITDHSDFRPLINKVSETVSSSGHEWNLTARPSGDLIRGLLFGSSISVQKRLDTTTGLGTSWKHIVFASDGTNLSFYLDGSLISATQSIVGGYSGMTNQSKPVRLGAVFINDLTYKDFFYGLQDDIRIFNRALSTSEIKHLASRRGVLGTPRNPVIKKRRIFYAPTAPVTTTAKAVVLKKPKPSYATGYARNASESANPNLWKGLVGAWMPSFGVTGGTLKDVSGNGNDGTLTNMDAATDWVATSKGLALDFDGVNDRVDIAGTVTGELTKFSAGCSFWLNVHDSSNGEGMFSQWGHGGIPTTAKWQLTIQPNRTLTAYIKSTNGSNYGVNGITVSDKSWLNVFMTVDGYKMSLFANGVLLGQTSYAGDVRSTTQNLTIGAYNTVVGNNQYFNGKIKNAFAYNRVLSPSEIKQLYLNPAAPFERKQQTVGISTAQAFNPYWANQATQLAGTLQ